VNHIALFTTESEVRSNILFGVRRLFLFHWGNVVTQALVEVPFVLLDELHSLFE
jgi:hypothetical protein